VIPNSEHRAGTTSELQSRPVPIHDFEKAIAELEYKTSDWFQQTYGASYQMCLDSAASRRFLWALCERTVQLQQLGADFSTPMVLLAATMLQMGYQIGRKHAETEVLEGWYKL
jgi:hypothetical protein